MNNGTKMFIGFMVWSICAAFALRGETSSQARDDADEFVVEKEISSKEKKYSEVQEDLILAYEELLRAQTKALHDVADAQEQCLDALKKVVVNTPKMARARIEKEVKRVKTQTESLKSARFF